MSQSIQIEALTRKVFVRSSAMMSLILVYLIIGNVSAFAFSPTRLPSTNNLPLAQQKTQSDLKLHSKVSKMPLYAEKKRRRRKDKPSGSDNMYNEVEQLLSDEDELPDFDLVEDIDVMENKKSAIKGSVNNPSAINAGSSPRKPVDVNDPEIMAAMRVTKGTGAISVSSTRELLRSRNRELERKLIVNDVVQEVPSLVEYTKSKGEGSKIGKKAAKREARIAAALESKGEGNSGEKSFFDLIPFLNKDGEKKSPIKLLEEGTWACIYILVAWEVYINSPFFERQAPMAPVVFTDPMTMSFLP